MNETIKNSIIFVLGAAAGAAVSAYVMKTKYEKIAQEEIDSVKKVYSERMKKSEPTENTEDTSSEEQDDEINDEEEYASIVARHYGIPKNDLEKGGSESMSVGTKPYTVSPEEFGEKEGYEIISLVYFEDGVLTDDQHVPVDNIEKTVGLDSLSKFGEYEDDSVFVRNDFLEIDYEILKDYRKYSDLNQQGDE